MADPEVQPSDFYVYEILVDDIVRYIGKGRGDRLNEHVRTARRILRIRESGETFKTSRFYNRLAKAVKAKAKIEIRIVQSGLLEEDAYLAETSTISSIGLDRLWNVFPGGIGFRSEWIKSLWKNPEYREKSSARSRARWQDPEYREHYSNIRRQPEHKAHMSAALKKALSDPEVKKKMSQKKVEAFKDPEFKRAFKEKMKVCRTKPEWKEKQSRSRKAKWADPEFRLAQSERYKKAWANPDHRAKKIAQAKAQQTEESRKQESENMKRLWRNPEYRNKARAVRSTPEFISKQNVHLAKIRAMRVGRKKYGGT